MRILKIAPEPFLEPRGTPFSVYHLARAVLVEPTPEGLARGALALLRDPQRAILLGEFGRQIAEKNYSRAAFLEKNRLAYNEFTGAVCSRGHTSLARAAQE
jgi:hypothetical protein